MAKAEKQQKRLAGAKVIVAVAAGLIVVGVQASVAAQPVNHDEFYSNGTSSPSASTINGGVQKNNAIKSLDENPTVQPGALAMMSGDTPVVRWFERVDNAIAKGMKSPIETTTLSQGFNQEVERVATWSKVAGEVSKRYKTLANQLRHMDVPANTPGLREYLALTADWYDDASQVYDELLKPRKAAQTMEELDEQLLRVKEKAKALKVTRSNLRAMDVSLRTKYKVHMPRYDDALGNYVQGHQD